MFHQKGKDSWCWLVLVVVVAVLSCTRSHGFSRQPAPSPRVQRALPTTRLFGLAEWREQLSSASDDCSSAQPTKEHHHHHLPVQPVEGTILLLPFRVEEALVPGQSITITLKHGRFFDLFEDALDEHCGMLGMILQDDDGVTPTMVLCEIQDFRVDAGFRGKITIHVTLQAVGRASLLELTAWKPIMTGLCRELIDDDTTVTSTTMEDSDNVRIKDLLDNIQSTLEVLGKQPHFQQAYGQALNMSETHPKEAETDSALVRDWTATSWAALAVTDSKCKAALLQQALGSTSVVERLQVGLKVLLEERFQRAEEGISAATPSSSYFSDAENSDNSAAFE